MRRLASKTPGFKLQALLAQRFQLKVHRAMKELPVFALTVGKNGSNLVERPGGAAIAKAGIEARCGQTIGAGALMTDLTVKLARELGSPVLDRTGLSGRYDFHFAWMPNAGPCSKPVDSADLPDGPSIFTAMQEQLGLKLESAKAPVEVVVIDHAEKAGGN